MTVLENPTTRKVIYALAAATGAALVALGFLDAGVSAQIVAVIGGILGLGVGGLAGTRVEQRPVVDDATAQVIAETVAQHVQAAGGAISAAQSTVDQVLADVRQRLGR